MIPVSKGQKAVRACTIRLLNLGHAKYEKVAICAVNQRISNIWRIAGAAQLRSNPGIKCVLKDLLTRISYYQTAVNEFRWNIHKPDVQNCVNNFLCSSRTVVKTQLYIAFTSPHYYNKKKKNCSVPSRYTLYEILPAEQ